MVARRKMSQNGWKATELGAWRRCHASRPRRAQAICSRIAELETAEALASNQHVACWRALDDVYDRPCDVSLRLAKVVCEDDRGWEHGFAQVAGGAGHGCDFKPVLSRSFPTRFGSVLDERSSLGTVSKRECSFLERARAEHPS